MRDRLRVYVRGLYDDAVELLAAKLVALIRANSYPDRAGQPIKSDPTYGRIDQDIQWMVSDMRPASLGSRVALENTAQNRRNDRRGVPRV